MLLLVVFVCGLARRREEACGAPVIATSEGPVSISLKDHSLGPLDAAFERKFSPYDGNGG